MAKKKRKRRSKAGKGPKFERDFCTMLSRWCAGRDDVFWRTAGSGSRATVRNRRGLSTHNHHGDICATHLDGSAFADCFVVSLKSGYRDCHASASLDRPRKKLEFELDKWIKDIKAKWQDSGSLSWMIVHQRRSRAAVVYMPATFVARVLQIDFNPILVMMGKGSDEDIVVVRLDNWFKLVTPKMIVNIVKKN